MKQMPTQKRRCGPEFLSQASGNNVMPWNRMDQKMTLYLCESARRVLRELHGGLSPGEKRKLHLIKPHGESAALVKPEVRQQ
jgi:hypothetical protein